MPREDAVVVATLAATDVPIQFLSSWGDLLQYDASRGRHLVDGGGTIKITSGPRIAEARSQLVDTFFADERLDASWLLMIDSDMTFEGDLIERMLKVADPEHVPILGGLCFAGGRDHAPYPTIYKEVEVTQDGAPFVGIEPIHDYPQDTLVKAGATGAACLLVHRQVFIAMSHPWPKGFGTTQDGKKNPYPWFIEGLVTPDGEPIGEDVAFCRRARQLGIPIHVDTSIKLGHVKNYILDERWYQASRDARVDAVDLINEERVAESAVVDRPPPEERRAAARAALAAEPDGDEILSSALG